MMTKPEFLKACLELASKHCPYYRSDRRLPKSRPARYLEHYCMLAVDSTRTNPTGTHECLFSQENCFCEAVIYAGPPELVPVVKTFPPLWDDADTIEIEPGVEMDVTPWKGSTTKTVYESKIPYEILMESSGRVLEDSFAGVALPNTCRFRVCRGCKKKLISVGDNGNRTICAECLVTPPRSRYKMR